MSDLARFLPLSHRSAGDDAAAPSDRRAQVASVVTLAAAVLTHEPAPATETFLREAGLAGADTSGSLSRLAETIATGRRRRIGDLTRVARAYLALPAERRGPLPFAVAGAVALAASTRAPFARRAAIAGHTVRATDAGWTFGRGPEISASADDIVAFLTGLSDTPPRRNPIS
ncbi:hypothetical protein [Microbacterium sp. cf332]|uniref:hypothetical protein n=1 Tax=Microbacterium sp. cf332 TaxID=1761804 RepID=UPI000880DE23|nr:hypothetical protein [Microbacterium sp. cf332]SDQ98933.1 hypothetical protein SAMN04487847_3129 [Microbacterium sp. cf332]